MVRVARQEMEPDRDREPERKTGPERARELERARREPSELMQRNLVVMNNIYLVAYTRAVLILF